MTTKFQLDQHEVKHPYLDKMLELAKVYQKKVCDQTAKIDGQPFKYTEHFGATPDKRFQSQFRLGLLEDSRLFEKASFVVAETHGKFTRETEISAHETAGPKESYFHATGFSMVFHPKHPKIPSTRIHYHLIVKDDGSFWYSGGGDLTPYYLFEEDGVNFHKLHKEPCDKFLGPDWYQLMKEASDVYFYLPHRGHIRGIGGTFFDNFSDKSFGKKIYDTKQNIESIYTFCEESCKIINDSYNSIVEKRQHEPFGERETKFMQLLRGRYTEFDLVYDRGITFGIKSGMPVEIPLLALPNSAWKYKFEEDYPEGSPEKKVLNTLYHPRKWV